MASILKVLALLGVAYCVSAAVPVIKFTDTIATTLTPVAINATTLVPEVVVHREAEHVLLETTTVAFVSTTERRTTVIEYFTQILRGDFVGARKCKKTKDCGTGLKCDMLLHWCVPLDSPAARETENACTKHEDCSEWYHCWNGACHFSGPRHCKTNADCMPGFPGLSWDCVDTKDLEKAWIKQQLLNRTTVVAELKPERNRDPRKNKDKHHDDHSGELGSTEWNAMGLPEGDFLTHGHRCWARCTDDKGCMSIRYPSGLFTNDTDTFGCFFNYCIRRNSFISLPVNFNSTIVFNVTRNFS
ncbi:hypothetical protein RvY_18582 [Ramazzottius varieornatus]|uniref:Chitin-binding type-2 domain-containing protein n=1 Tax=Ramazzottius varieornatus TaxID=947166 RepID=A0A1D1W6A5_RAMVA|nr:hypothetical protein RvY_18582 [Ramazzottius varieornatus]